MYYIVFQIFKFYIYIFKFYIFQNLYRQCWPTGRHSWVLRSGCRAQWPHSWLQAGSWHSCLQGLGRPKACIGLQVSGARSHGSYLKGPECLKAGVGLLVEGPGPSQTQSWCWTSGRLWDCGCPGAGVWVLVVEAGFEQACWWAGPGPREHGGWHLPAGGWNLFPGSLAAGFWGSWV